MKIRIAILIALAACLVGAFFINGSLNAKYADALALYDSQNAQLDARRKEVDELQAAVNQLNEQIASLTMDDVRALEKQAEEIQAQIDEIETRITETKAMIGTITADTEAKQEELARLQEEHAYFLEVYDELNKGLEMVKGYIAGN